MYKKIGIILLAVIMSVTLGACNNSDVRYYADSTKEETTEAAMTEAYSREDDGQELVPVYVCGAVFEPGVYYLDEAALKEDALMAAGGFDLGAAEGYVNLAENIVSGEKIYFPYEEELVEGGGLIQEADISQSSGKININTATKEELMTLPGIGESKAQAIIKYREEYGPFQSIEDITNISGIKEGVYNNIKEYIIVN